MSEMLQKLHIIGAWILCPTHVSQGSKLAKTIGTGWRDSARALPSCLDLGWGRQGGLPSQVEEGLEAGQGLLQTQPTQRSCSSPLGLESQQEAPVQLLCLLPLQSSPETCPT